MSAFVAMNPFAFIRRLMREVLRDAEYRNTMLSWHAAAKLPKGLA